MEGIDAHVTPEGDTVLTMVSDDNFSLIQRTLLLQFTLVECSSDGSICRAPSPWRRLGGIAGTIGNRRTGR